MKFNRKVLGVVIFLLVVFLATTAFATGSNGNGNDVEFGIISLIPPVLAIVLAFVTKQVILSLLLGIFSGALIYTFAFSGANFFMKIVESYIKMIDYTVVALADEWHAGILIFTLTIGGMVGVIAKMGGMKAVAEALAKKAKTSKSAMLATMLLGVVIFFDDYANTLIVGNTMRPLTDKMKVSREKLAYIVDSTAAPIAGIALISTWIGYELGLIGDALGAVNIEANAYDVFLRSIPYRFYDILAIVMVFLIAFLAKDFGAMYKAEKRARLEGKVLSDTANPLASSELDKDFDENKIPLKISNAIVPIVVLIVTAFVGLWYSGGGTELPFNWSGIRTAFGDADASVSLIWAAFLASAVAIAMAVGRKIMNLQEAFDSWVEGAKALFITAVILILAWSIGSVTSDLGTADYLVGVVSSALPGWILPSLIFGIACLVAFSTGTSWGTMAILMPLAIPLAASYSGGTVDRLMLATIGSVLTGAIFGDHVSPISDTTIMSSMASSSDHMDHVKTQAPYALVVAGVSIAIGYIPAGLGLPGWVSLLIGAGALFAIVNFLGKDSSIDALKVEKKKEE